MPVWVSALASADSEMPKSSTRGPSIRDDHIRGFQVAVDHAGRVDRAQALSQPGGQRQHRIS